jgi:hypothetical protein
VHLQPVTNNNTLQFLVNERGEALVLHKGPLQHLYSWLQYDRYTETIQFVTDEGDIQEFGAILPELIKRALPKTHFVTLIELNGVKSCKHIMRLVFNNVLA